MSYPIKFSDATLPLRNFFVELSESAHGEISPVMEIMALRGEAILRLRFFELMEEFGVVDQADKVFTMWQGFRADDGLVESFARNVLLSRFVHAGKDELAIRKLRTLWYALIWHLKLHQPDLLEIATDVVIWHKFRQILTHKENEKTSAKSRLVKLKEAAHRKVSTTVGFHVVLKESFKNVEGCIQFQLRFKGEKHSWVEFLLVKSKRLSIARELAYKVVAKSTQEEVRQLLKM